MPLTGWASPKREAMEPLPPSLEAKRHSVQQILKRPVLVRGIRVPDPDFRGRLQVEPSRVLIEYQVAQPGYFWHIPIIEELLDQAVAGRTTAELREAADESEG
jgi:hypothetical protein